MPFVEKYSYIETFGCQMNDRDSEIMNQLLSESYLPTHEIANADVVVVNTCSIRKKAEEKAFSLLGRLRQLKAGKPSMRIAVVGCVAQQEGQQLINRMPFVDLVLGTQNIYNLPELLERVSNGKEKIVAVEQTKKFNIPAFLPRLQDGPPHKRFVTIGQGCNNYCTYCVVPYTRGREVSRDFQEIIDEVEHLCGHGVKEITLLGQNVNSYGQDMGEEGRTFSELLRRVAEVDGLQRLRFTTSNPKDLTEDLIRCFADIDLLCPHFHLPVQSGSNAVLKRMNRKYTIEDYMEQVRQLREARPGIAISTDLIVGFPGETEEDFQATMDLVEKVRYHSAFSFKYSDRPQARSVEFDGKLSEEEKAGRLKRLQKRIDEIVVERNNEYVGNVETVMVEGRSKNSDKEWKGRSGTNHVVNFKASSDFNQGDMVEVMIEEGCKNSLRGSQVTEG